MYCLVKCLTVIKQTVFFSVKKWKDVNALKSDKLRYRVLKLYCQGGRGQNQGNSMRGNPFPPPPPPQLTFSCNSTYADGCLGRRNIWKYIFSVRLRDIYIFYLKIIFLFVYVCISVTYMYIYIVYNSQSYFANKNTLLNFNIHAWLLKLLKL